MIIYLKKNNMKQFSLQKYLENPKRKVVTRNGRPVKIICTCRRGLYVKPIIALITIPNDNEVIKTYWEDGIEIRGTEYENDLFFETTEKEGWINIYKTDKPVASSTIYNSEQEAKADIYTECNYADTIKIEWNE